MSEPGAVLDAAKLGVRVEIRETAASTGGEYVEFDVVGRARGLIAQAHVHVRQVERHEVIEAGCEGRDPRDRRVDRRPRARARAG